MVHIGSVSRPARALKDYFGGVCRHLSDGEDRLLSWSLGKLPCPPPQHCPLASTAEEQNNTIVVWMLDWQHVIRCGPSTWTELGRTTCISGAISPLPLLLPLFPQPQR